MQRPENNQKGIALMVVLWVLVLLTALATEFAFSMRTEVSTTRNYKEDVESYFLAKAGINLAFAEILQKARFHSIHDEHGFIVGKLQAPATLQKQDTLELQDAQNEENKDFSTVNRTDIPLGAGTISYAITDENGKININKVSRETLVKILGAAGIEIGENRDVIADSILDWVDKDDDHKLNGAENDYYQNLTPPYSAKNDFFDSINELLKVRGITEEILYGTPEEQIGDGSRKVLLGLDKFFTVQDVLSFNPNTADPAILPVYFDEAKVEDILAKRSERGFYNDSLSSHFKIECTGKIDGSRTRHTVIAIVQKFGNSEKSTLLIRYWNDNAVES